ncbi:ATP-binding protein [Microbacterium sp. B2969]|uniref:ATP-binding protein n=1 Tax=Microbacterium alkaliflavum TaxID=3248839 RepID=A0ABW7QCQ4_9MICO
MSELAYHAAPVTSRDSRDLTSRAGRVAAMVATVVEQHCTPESGAMDAVTFLRDWAASADPAGAPTHPHVGSPLQRVVRAFSLTDEEVDLIVLAGVPEEHEGLATTFRSLHPTGEPRPTAGLAALLLGGGRSERTRLRGMLSSGSAVRHGLVQLEGAGPFFERSIVLADELWSALHGCDAWPTELTRVASVGTPPGMRAWLDVAEVQACIGVIRQGARALIAVPHEDAVIGRARCEAIAAAAGREVVGAAVSTIDERTTRLLVAHATARGGVPMIVLDRADRRVGVPLGDFNGPVLVTAAPGSLEPPPDRALLRVDAGPVPLGAMRDAWAAAVPGLAGDAGVLVARHPLDPTITAQLGRDLAVAGRALDPRDVSKAVRTRTGASLPPGVRLVVPDVDWSQLVLPPDSLGQLHAAVNRLAAQSTVLDDWRMREHTQATRGVRMLFTGLPGTGKSLAAAVLAAAVGTDLMVVDVARLVSKWLGETEKNLAATFEAAERTRAVLLLDEADALFGTRTEISDSHDRYANLETAYLLQRIEQFDGLIVLTSNLRQNIDTAFTRRLDFVVDFPLPDLPARTALWRRFVPEELGSVRAADLDLDGLARIYPVPGGWIRNAAVTAAFAAASTGEPITQRRLVDAVRREYLKTSTPFPGEPPRRRDDHDR